MEIFGYIAFVFIGITLGLIGGGGSILTVPLFVYGFGIEPLLATSYSLFIVGTSSLIGSFPKYKQNLVSLKTAIVFGIPSISSIFVTRKFILPKLPEVIFSIGNTEFTKSILLMILFAVLMIAASTSMIRNKKMEVKSDTNSPNTFNYPLLILEGALVGMLTGMVGAGGGFLIIPALIMLGKLEMKIAVGTSLLIISTNSLLGFLGDITSNHHILDWMFLIKMAVFAVTGIFIGHTLSKKIDGAKLKQGFGWFVLVLGIYIIVHELILKRT